MPATGTVNWADATTRKKCFDHLTAMLRILELRLPYMQGRADRILGGCEIIGTTMKLRGKTLFSLMLAAKFHDLGMLAVPDTVLFREGPIRDEEKKLLNEHPHLGGFLVSKSYPDFPDAAEAIWYHHERPDGQGMYGLRDSEIPRLAAVVSLVSAIESMANTRPHRRAMSLDEIIEEVTAELDKQFNRRVVAAFRQDAQAVYDVVGPNSTVKAVTIADVCAGAAASCCGGPCADTPCDDET